MFWERFYTLCQRIGKKPNPVGKEIGLSSGIISKWKSGGIPNGETLMKLSSYFHVSVDYLLGLSDTVEIEDQIHEESTSSEAMRRKVMNNMERLNDQGMCCLADYSDYLVGRTRYCTLPRKLNQPEDQTDLPTE